jgi:hypothetical protein
MHIWICFLRSSCALFALSEFRRRYNLLTHNCNNFTNEVAHFLLGQSIPSYIIGLPAEVSSFMLCVSRSSIRRCISTHACTYATCILATRLEFAICLNPFFLMRIFTFYRLCQPHSAKWWCPWSLDCNRSLVKV